MPKTFTDLERHALNGSTMGTRWSALFHMPRDFDPAPVAEAMAAAVAQVDVQMSTWKPESDLMRLNAAAAGTWIDLPEQLTEVLACSLEVGRASGGAFDIGLGDAVAAWGFGPAAADAGGIRTALAVPRRPAHDVLELDPAQRRARKHGPLTLDLSGIAKGYGVDRLAQVAKQFGIPGALVGDRWRAPRPWPAAGRQPLERRDRTARPLRPSTPFHAGAPGCRRRHVGRLPPRAGGGWAKALAHHGPAPWWAAGDVSRLGHGRGRAVRGRRRLGDGPDGPRQLGRRRHGRYDRGRRPLPRPCRRRVAPDAGRSAVRADCSGSRAIGERDWNGMQRKPSDRLKVSLLAIVARRPARRLARPAGERKRPVGTARARSAAARAAAAS